MGEILKFEQVIESYISGDWGNDESSEEASCAVSCIRGADIVPIRNSDFANIPTRYISSRSLAAHALQEGDIVIEKSGGSPTQSTGRVVYISKELLDAKGDVVCSNFCVAFRVKAEWNPKYIYYYLCSIYNADVFFNFEGKTSGLKNLQVEAAFKAIPIKKNAIEEQASIANTLSIIESKLAVNRQINDNLEAMAKQLYDYWFVQFDFPNEEGKPYKSSGGKMVWNDKLKREIPAIFKASFLGELCSFRNGINYAKDEIGEQFEIINVRNISSSKILLDGESFDTISVPASRAGNYIVKDNDIIIARSGCPGSTRLLLSPSNILFCGFIICCTPNEPVMRNYLTYCLKQLEGTSATTSGGSILQNVSQDTLKSLCVAQPTIDVLEKFNDIISSLFARMLNCLTENKMLIKQRDELLPLLMNGQVSVNYHLSDD